MASQGNRDPACALACLAGSSTCLRVLALPVLATIASDVAMHEVLLGCSTPELKLLLRRLRKAGRTAVLQALVEHWASLGGGGTNLQSLELVLPYGSGEQVEKLWSTIETAASSFTWGIMSNYHPEFVADRVAATPATSRADVKGDTPRAHRYQRLQMTQTYLLLHCPTRVWSILEGLPKWQLRALDLSAFVRAFPGETLAMLLKLKDGKDEEDEEEGEEEKKEGATAAAAAAAAPPAPAPPPAPPVYVALTRGAFLEVEGDSSPQDFGRRLLSRVGLLPDEQLLQALMQYIVGPDALLRNLPVPRRVALYELWKATWSSQAAALIGLRRQLATATGTPDEPPHVKAAILSVQRSAFNCWLQPDDLKRPGNGAGSSNADARRRRGARGCDGGGVCARADGAASADGWLPRWLPRAQCADLILTLIEAAPELFDAVGRRATPGWLSRLPAEFLFSVLSRHPALLDCEASEPARVTLVSRLTWQQQLELHRLRSWAAHARAAEGMALSAEDPVECLDALQLPTASVLALLPPRRAGPSSQPQPSLALVRQVARHILSGLAPRQRSLLLATTKGPCPATDATPTTKTYALAGIYDDWLSWWGLVKEGLTEIEASMAQLSPPVAGERSMQLHAAVSRCLLSCARVAAFRPWVSAADLWARLPEAPPPESVGGSGGARGSGGGAPGSARGPRLGLLLALQAAGCGTPYESGLTACLLYAADAKAATATAAGGAAAAALSTREADAVAELEPQIFLQRPRLLSLLSSERQVSLLQDWAKSREGIEAALHTLLGSLPPSRAALLTTVQDAGKQLLQSRDSVASGALVHVGPDAKGVLYDACQAAWLSEWGTVSAGELPEPHRTAVARMAVAKVVKEETKIGFSPTPVELPWLPWEEMIEFPLLRDRVNGGSAQERSMGLQYLFNAAKINHAHMPHALAQAHKRAREQDMVRLVLLQETNSLIEERLQAEESGSGGGGPTVAEQLPALALLVDDALGAKDLSASSMREVFKMLLRLLPRHTAWACSQMERTVAVCGMAFVALADFDASVRQVMATYIAELAAVRAAAALAGDAEASASLHDPIRPAGLSDRTPCPALEAFLVEVVGGMRGVAQALGRRQDGVPGVLSLLQTQWAWGVTADDAHKALVLTKADDKGAPVSALRAVLLEQASDAVALLSPMPAGSLSCWPQLSFLGGLLLEQLPDSFLPVRHHLLPSSQADGAAFGSQAAQLLPQVPKDRLDLLLPFAEENATMPAVAASTVSLLFKHHQGALPEVVPRLLARDVSFACLPKVLSFMLGARQDLFTLLLRSTATTATTAATTDGADKLRTGMFASGPPGGHDAGGYSGRAAFDISVWLGLPPVRSPWKWTASQQEALAAQLVRVLRAGTLSLADIKGLVSRIASLPAVPASLLLSLLDDPSGDGDTPAAAAAAAGAAGGGQPEAVSSLVKDSVLASLVRLDDAAQAWGALVDSVQRGTSTTALAAIGTLLTGRWATHGDVGQVLERLRSLPWQRVSVLKEVVKVLGKVASGGEPAAFAELVSIAGRTEPPLHRSVQQQLLSTLQAFVHTPEAQAFFMRSASSADFEVAKVAAFVPDAVQQRGPGVVSHTVVLFEQLLVHHDARVKLAAMTAWADASAPISLERGMTVLNKMVSMGEGVRSENKQKALLGQRARALAAQWFSNVLAKQPSRGPGDSPPSSTGVGSSSFDFVDDASVSSEGNV
ncbi:hypothetical protein FOA52_008579 [Chlamydomonas sp. UWO 241]|nr:hypothetical protein FOA52_008579 [Chlamydomonas sp. UWO 241]